MRREKPAQRQHQSQAIVCIQSERRHERFCSERDLPGRLLPVPCRDVSVIYVYISMLSLWLWRPEFDLPGRTFRAAIPPRRPGCRPDPRFRLSAIPVLRPRQGVPLFRCRTRPIFASDPPLLCILDGWGWRADDADNAIALAIRRTTSACWRDCPHALLATSGRAVGLPDGQMGNSEVGHMNIGAGRIVMQDLPRIDDAVARRRLAKRPALVDADRARRRAAAARCI